MRGANGCGRGQGWVRRWHMLVTEDNAACAIEVEVAEQGGINFDVVVRTKKIAQHPGAILAKGGQNQCPRQYRQQLRSGNKTDKRVVFDLGSSCFQSMFN